jgi:hypothetical protein
MVRRYSVMVRCGSVMVRCGSVMVQHGSVMVQRGSFMVRLGSVGSLSACCNAARFRFSARHYREMSPTKHTSDEEMEGASANGVRYN